MNIETLRLFVETAYRLSFAAVAEDRHINPSSVSRAISQLERDLSARLFQRSTRAMMLTEEGETFLQSAQNILREFDEGRDQLQNLTTGPSGLLKMTTSVAFGEHMIVPLLPNFHKSYPGIELDLTLSDSNLDLLSENIDLAIRLGAEVTSDLVISKLMPTHYKVCASPDYIARTPTLHHPSDLINHDCIMYALPGFRTNWTFREKNSQKSEGFQVSVKGNLAISSALSMRSMALNGVGPALLANWLVDDDLKSGQLQNLFPSFEATTTTYSTAAWIVYPSKAYLPQKVRAMIDFLRARLAGAAGIEAAT